jgi:hypothetical protein
MARSWSFSGALAGLTSANDRQHIEGMLDNFVTSSPDGSTRDLTAFNLAPLDRDARGARLCFAQRCAATEKAMTSLQANNSRFAALMDEHAKSEKGKNGGSPLNDPTIRSMVKQELGGREPVLNKGDIEFSRHETSRATLKTPQTILKDSFLEALGQLAPPDPGRFDDRLDQILPLVRENIRQ